MISKLETETDEQFLERLYWLYHQNQLTMPEVMEIANENLNKTYTVSKYKHEYARHYRDKLDLILAGLDSNAEYIPNTVDENESEVKEQTDEEKLTDLFRAIQKERYKLSDERIQNNAILRRISREETIKEIAEQAARIVSQQKELLTFNPVKDTQDKEAILVISDWHYGLEIDSFFNKYNTEICKQRVQNLQDKVIEKCLDNDIRTINVVNLQDLIAGRIHSQIRLQSRIDVITQIQEVTEIVAEFLTNLSRKFNINYYDCLDNHSRIEPNMKDSLELESLVRFMSWYLKPRLEKNRRIKIFQNEISDDIISFMCKGHKIIAVHGHKDKSGKIIDNLNSLTQEHHDLILSAHEHHFSADEKNHTIRLSSGTLMGTDDYSESLRLSSEPSQLLVFVTEENVTDTVCRIVVE